MSSFGYMRDWIVESCLVEDEKTFNRFAAVHVLEYVHSTTSEASLRKDVEETMKRWFPDMFETLLKGYEEWISRHFETWKEGMRGMNVYVIAEEWVEYVFYGGGTRHIKYEDGDLVFVFPGNRGEVSVGHLADEYDDFSVRDIAVVLGKVDDDDRLFEILDGDYDKPKVMVKMKMRMDIANDVKEFIADYIADNFTTVEKAAQLLDDIREFRHRDKRVYVKILPMYAELLKWREKKVGEWGSLMTRGLQVAHVTAQMGSYVGLTDKELDDMNYLDMLPASDMVMQVPDKREKWLERLFRGVLNGQVPEVKR